MDDQQRLSLLKEKLASFEGLDAPTFDRMMSQLSSLTQPFGADDSGRLRVVFFDARPYDVGVFERLSKERIVWHYVSAALDEDTVGAVENCRAICIFVNDRCDRPVVEALATRGVGLIALRCAGFNQVDLEACQEHGINVVRVPAYSPYAVAEHSVALMMTLNRKLHQAYNRNRAGTFILDGLTGFDMHGKTIGVVGTGAIGSCLIKILLGFGCKIIAYDKHPDPELEQLANVAYRGLDDLFSESDIVSLHVPLLPDTHYLINDKAIDQMKEGAMLINTSRGGLVDSKALIRGLKSGKIGAAGLDVYEEEAGVFFHDRSNQVLTDDVLARLLTFNNVLITSHQGFLTKEALDEIASTTFRNVTEFLDGKRGRELSNVVLPPT